MGSFHLTRTLACLLLILVHAIFESACVEDENIIPSAEKTDGVPTFATPSAIDAGTGDCLCRPQVIVQLSTCNSDPVKICKLSSCNCSNLLRTINAELQDVKQTVAEVMTLLTPKSSNTTSVVTKVEPKCTTSQLGDGLTSSDCSAGVQVAAGTRCKYLCADGIAMQGSNTVSCGSDGQWDQPLPSCKVTLDRDCSDAVNKGFTKSGIYFVQPTDNGEPIEVFCDMETDYGGWTVFQRRQDGSVNFYRDFATYETGFGDMDGEFWLGNEDLHRLTSQANYELRLDLMDHEGVSVYAVYFSFSIGNRDSKYTLNVEGFTGTAGDALIYHNGKGFSTKDQDNDDSTSHCALEYHGAWWYKSCAKSNLNGWYLGPDNREYGKGIAWFAWKTPQYSLKKTEMKFRFVG